MTHVTYVHKKVLLFNWMFSVGLGNTEGISDVHPFAIGRGCSDLSDTPHSKKKGYSANINTEHGKNLQFSAQQTSGKCKQVPANGMDFLLSSQPGN